MKVATDVTDANGKVVIPSGSVVTLQIVQIAEASNRGEKGTLVLSANDVDIDGVTYRVIARASDYAYEMKARPIGAGEVAQDRHWCGGLALLGHAIGGKRRERWWERWAAALPALPSPPRPPIVTSSSTPAAR